MSATIAAHELDLHARRARRARAAASPRALGRHPRGMHARRRHLARRTASRSRPRRPSTRSPRASSSTAIEPGGNRVEVTTGGALRLRPRRAVRVWTEAERKKGQAWGVKTVESLPHVRHPSRRLAATTRRDQMQWYSRRALGALVVAVMAMPSTALAADPEDDALAFDAGQLHDDHRQRRRPCRRRCARTTSSVTSRTRSPRRRSSRGWAAAARLSRTRAAATRA